VKNKLPASSLLAAWLRDLANAGGTGGLNWHVHAVRSLQRWLPTRELIAAFLAGVQTSEKHLLLIGCSAGWMLPTPWLARFERIDIYDIDPLVPLLFGLRHGRELKQQGIAVRYHRQDAIAGLPGLLAQHPQACLWFDNVLGQVSFRLGDEDIAERQLGQLKKMLAGRSWGSLHDVYSGPIDADMPLPAYDSWSWTRLDDLPEDAAKVRAAVLGNFRKLAADIEASIKMARQTGEVWTSWDGQPARRRSMVGIADPDDGLKSAAERQSYNTRVQGSASDLCLTSVAQIVQWIVDDCVPAKLVMTVHDSILVECDKSVQDEVVYQMRRIMESQPCGGVPIVVDVEVGDAGELLVGALRLKRPVGQVGRTKQCRLRSVAVALRPVTRRALRQEQRLRRGHRIGAVCHRRRRARGLLAGVVRWAPLAQV
jgi:hypothetical protein